MSVSASVAVAALSIAGCSSSSPPASNGVDASDASASAALDASDAPACSLPGRFGSAKCDTCVLDRCCTQLAACRGDPDCATLATCTLACINELDAGGCATECRARTADRGGTWGALEKCAYFTKTTCAFECSVSPQ